MRQIIFEAANPHPVLQRVPIESAFPGWRGWIGVQEQAFVIFGGTSLGGAGLQLIDRHDPDLRFGKYFASIFSGGSLGQGGVSASLAQQGDIPLDAKTLVFDPVEAAFDGDPKFYRVSVDGTALRLGRVNESLWGADISICAGKNVDLRFEALYREDPISPQSFLTIDNIAFSTSALPTVPEPAPMLLFVAGALILGWSRHKRS